MLLRVGEGLEVVLLLGNGFNLFVEVLLLGWFWLLKEEGVWDWKVEELCVKLLCMLLKLLLLLRLG